MLGRQCTTEYVRVHLHLHKHMMMDRPFGAPEGLHAPKICRSALGPIQALRIVTPIA